MASLADICTVNSVSHSASCPATPTRGIGKFGTPRTVFSPVSYSPAKPAACNVDGKTCCSIVLLKSVRPLLEKLASQGVADGQHKPAKVHVVPDAPDVKRPGIGRFGGKPAAAVLAPAPVVVTAAPLQPSAAAAVTPSAVVAPVVVPEVAPVAPVASTTLQVPEASVTTEKISEEANARAADPSEKARWAKLRQEVQAMDVAMTRVAYLRNGCSSKARPAVRAGGKASSRQASGVKQREEGGCGEGAAGRAAGGRQGGVKAAGGRAVASGVCGREGVKQQAGRREGLVHERPARPGCSSSRAHRKSS
ncbi:unnamed protein product [Closterium sp. Naga37s-1]|nr:unnamed protein product [Closterium sp. Naga37s-1]